MIAKILIVVGALSFFAGTIGTIHGIYSSFAAMKGAEVNGLSDVIGGIENAIYSNVLGVVGMIVLVIGLILFFKQKRFKPAQ